MHRLPDPKGNHHAHRQDIRFLASLGFIVTLELVLFLSAGYLQENRIWGGDGDEYHRLAVNLIEHRAFSLSQSEPFTPSLLRTPAYPIYLAVLYSILGRSFVIVRLAQLILNGLTAWLVYRISLHFISSTWAMSAGLFCAAYPPLASYALFHLTESLITALLVLFIYLLNAFQRRSDGFRLRALVLGLVIGLAGLVRPTCALLLILGAAIMTASKHLSPRQRKEGIAIFLFSCCVLWGSWAARNYYVSRHLVPFGTLGGQALFASAEQYAGIESYKFPVSDSQIFLADKRQRLALIATSLGAAKGPTESQSELALDASYRESAKETLKKVTLTNLPKNILSRLAYMWSTADPLPPGHPKVHRAIQFEWVLIVVIIGAGIIMHFRSLGSTWPLWGLAMYFTTIHMLFFSEPRYTIPARPLLMVYIFLLFEKLASYCSRNVSVKAAHTHPETEEQIY